MQLGILAIQGAFSKHFQTLKNLNQPEPTLIRKPEDLKNLSAVFLPGGESSTMSKLLRFNELTEPLQEEIDKGLPIFATCAGIILLAKEVTGGVQDQHQFSALNISVARNAYGRQNESFEADIDIPKLEGDSFEGVFIRSPIVTEAGKEVEILATHDSKPVLCQQGNILAATFHPELTDDARLHKYFLESIVKNQR